jgi:hypothetical protein
LSAFAISDPLEQAGRQAYCCHEKHKKRNANYGALPGRFLDGGRIEMDTNSVERAMRHIPGVAEGGKNEGSHSSAELWKPKSDDQLRALAASGESSF